MNLEPFPISMNREFLSLSQIEVEKIIHIFLESRDIRKSYCSKCHSWQCSLETIEGLVCFNVTLFPSDTPNEVVVEFQRISGSSLIFGSIFREFKSKREESFDNKNHNLNNSNNNDINNLQQQQTEENGKEDDNHNHNHNQQQHQQQHQTYDYGSETIERLQIQDPPSLSSQESEKAIEALRYWLSFDPLEAATAIECLRDPDISTIPSFKLLKMEAIREKTQLTNQESSKLEHNHHTSFE